MKKISKYIFILIILFSFWSPTSNLEASTANPYEDCIYNNEKPPKPTNYPCDQIKPYTLLTPIPNGEGRLIAEIPVADSNALGVYLNLIIKIVIGLCAVLAVLMVFIGGIEYITSELAHSKEHGKERIIHALLGLAIALGAYTILYTINPDLLKSNLDSLENVVLEIQSDDIPQTPVNGNYQLNGTLYPENTDWTTISTQAPTALGNIATATPPGDCLRVGQRSCTSLRGLSLSTVNQIKAGCPDCEIIITGGTEFWLHSTTTTHRPGSGTIDLRTNDKLNKFLSGGKPLTKMRRYPDKNGPYLYEGDHWHIGK